MHPGGLQKRLLGSLPKPGFGTFCPKVICLRHRALSLLFLFALAVRDTQQMVDVGLDRHGLPHINPHAFRHTMASMLYFNGVDSVSISKRLGHAQVSTTANIYAHVVEEADRKNAEILSDIFLKKA